MLVIFYTFIRMRYSYITYIWTLNKSSRQRDFIGQKVARSVQLITRFAVLQSFSNDCSKRTGNNDLHIDVPIHLGWIDKTEVGNLFTNVATSATYKTVVLPAYPLGWYKRRLTKQIRVDYSNLIKLQFSKLGDCLSIRTG